MKFLKTLPPLFMFSTMMFANPWTGQLVDASCYDAKKDAAQQCKISETTTSFGIVADGKVYKLDASGNTKAAQLVKDSADKANVMAKVSGELSGDTITVTTVELQK